MEQSNSNSEQPAFLLSICKTCTKCGYKCVSEWRATHSQSEPNIQIFVLFCRMCGEKEAKQHHTQEHIHTEQKKKWNQTENTQTELNETKWMRKKNKIKEITFAKRWTEMENIKAYNTRPYYVRAVFLSLSLLKYAEWKYTASTNTPNQIIHTHIQSYIWILIQPEPEKEHRNNNNKKKANTRQQQQQQTHRANARTE